MKILPDILLSSVFVGFVLGIVAYILFFSNVARADSGQPPIGDTAAYGRLLRYAEEHDVTVTSQHSVAIEHSMVTLGHSDGHGNVWVASDVTPDERTCILAHELAHAVSQSPRMAPDDMETEAYYVGWKVCDALGYHDAGQRQLLQIRRFHGRISVRALLFADEVSTVAAG